MPFNVKQWLDDNVVAAGILGGDPDKRLKIHAPLWNGDPPKEVLVFLLAEPDAWAGHVKRLLEQNLGRFDYLREQLVVKLDTGIVPIFGGDGAPIFGKTGMVSVRLFSKASDGTHLILQIGAQCSDGIDAALKVKEFFAQFGENAIQICHTYAAPFGAA